MNMQILSHQQPQLLQSALLHILLYEMNVKEST